MDIQWYPGHMAKAKRLLLEKLKLIDLGIVVVDARAPWSTSNPDIFKLLSNKELLIVLNKSDLANDTSTRSWLEYFRNNSQNAIPFNAVKDNKNILLNAINKATLNVIQKYKNKGMNKTIRVLVAGIPNVGKSSIINCLVGKSITKTGDKAGVTKGSQWVRISSGLELLDSVGMLWPKIEPDDVAIKIAALGCLPQETIDTMTLSEKLIELLNNVCPNAISARYNISKCSSHEVIEEICKKRGFLLKENEFDLERGSKTLLNEFRQGKLGRITLDHFSL